MLLYGEYPDAAANAGLFATLRPAGREGNGGGFDAGFVVAGAEGAAVMVVGAEVIVGAGVGVAAGGANKGAAEVAALLC